MNLLIYIKLVNLMELVIKDLDKAQFILQATLYTNLYVFLFI